MGFRLSNQFPPRLGFSSRLAFFSALSLIRFEVRDGPLYLVGFLMQDLGVSSVAVAIAHCANTSLGPLHLRLCQLGLLSTQQLNLVFV